MRVLMFGWEFPPHISGGLGTASFGLTKGMATLDDLEVIFVAINCGTQASVAFPQPTRRADPIRRLVCGNHDSSSKPRWQLELNRRVRHHP
jgi:hypothetical protein